MKPKNILWPGSRLFLMSLISLLLFCACPGRGVVVLPAATSAEEPAWANLPSGSLTSGPRGEGFYGFGRAESGKDTTNKPDDLLAEADNRAMEMLSLTIDRFWNRSLSYLTKKTGAYGLFRTFEGAPCRVSFNKEHHQVVEHWHHINGEKSMAMAFLSREDLANQLTACKGCKEHPLCKMMGANLDLLLTDFTAWSEVSWTSDEAVLSWVKRGPGPYVDGPAGRGFYGVGTLDDPTDLAISTLDLQYRAALSLRETLLDFLRKATGKDVRLDNTYDSITPPCITAIQKLSGDIIEMGRLPDGRPVASLAFVPADRVRAATKDCPGCQEYNICRALYDRFDELFMTSSKQHQIKVFNSGRKAL